VVFNNIAVIKPFEEWLRALAEGEDDFNKLRERYVNSLNIESLTFLRNALADRLELERERASEED
jgi:hypothetical protein